MRKYPCKSLNYKKFKLQIKKLNMEIFRNVFRCLTKTSIYKKEQWPNHRFRNIKHRYMLETSIVCKLRFKFENGQMLKS